MTNLADNLDRRALEALRSATMKGGKPHARAIARALTYVTCAELARADARNSGDRDYAMDPAAVAAAGFGVPGAPNPDVRDMPVYHGPQDFDANGDPWTAPKPQVGGAE